MAKHNQLLSKDFFLQDDVVLIARQFLGMKLSTQFNGQLTSGIIVETEAYAGVIDKASHAFGGRRTASTEIMYQEGGRAYVYLCYGIHHLFNVVTSVVGNPHAVLIRGIEPVEGIDIMLQRRKYASLKSALTAGPGSLAAALGINKMHSGMSLGDAIKIERAISITQDQIISGTRVGVGYAGEDALLPYRFWVKGNKYISKGKGL